MSETLSINGHCRHPSVLARPVADHSAAAPAVRHGIVPARCARGTAGLACLAAAVIAGFAAPGTAAAPRLVASVDAGTIFLGAVIDQDWGRPVGAGDFDGDGFDDLVIVASESFGGITSTVHVVRGGRGAHGLGTIDLPATPADLVISGAELDDNLGASIAAGDINGDGIDDLIAVASMADFAGINARGIAYVLFGGADFYASPTRSMSNAADWDVRILGPVAGGDMGGALVFGGLDSQAAAVGNLNGDAYGDLVLGVHLANGTRTQAGRVYVVFGEEFVSGTTLNLAVPGDFDVQVWGVNEYDELGTVVAVGDITGDGIDELIMPCEYWSKGIFTSEGAVFVLRGRTTWSSLYNLRTAAADITLRGARKADSLGEAAAIGDFNGDGTPDLAAAAPGADAGTLNDQRGDGIVYGLLGGPQYQTGTLTIDFATAAADFTFVGEFEENLGTLVAAGDFDGDGIDDLAAAERFAGPNTNGVVEVLLGRDFVPGASFTAAVDSDIRIVGAMNDRIGFWLTAANTNGDALDEVVFSTPFNNNDAGTAYVYTYVSADVEPDGDVDLHDLAALQPCIGTVFSGPPTMPCVLLDFTLDEAVDGADLPDLETFWTGPATP